MIVAGGSYREICLRPSWHRIFGSGGRAAAVVGRLSPGSSLHTYAHAGWAEDVRATAASFGVTADVTEIAEEVIFEYLHPMSAARQFPAQPTQNATLSVSGKVVLRFGFVEGEAVVDGEWVVFDPQGAGRDASYRANGSTAGHLAVVLNEQELLAATGPADVAAAAAVFAAREGAEVVVVKRGVCGALLHHAGTGNAEIPAYRSERVFKIGSGDVFSAAFAHYWGELGLAPAEAADMASRSVCAYVNDMHLPLPDRSGLAALIPVPIGMAPGQVYLAGPFFTTGQRWLVEEARAALMGLGAGVFSPLHEVGTNLPASVVAPADLAGLERCSAVLALVDGRDLGTIYEVGYARARGIPVVALAENVADGDLTMLEGTGCQVVGDVSTALYRAIWATMS